MGAIYTDEQIEFLAKNDIGVLYKMSRFVNEFTDEAGEKLAVHFLNLVDKYFTIENLSKGRDKKQTVSKAKILLDKSRKIAIDKYYDYKGRKIYVMDVSASDILSGYQIARLEKQGIPVVLVAS